MEDCIHMLAIGTRPTQRATLDNDTLELDRGNLSLTSHTVFCLSVLPNHLRTIFMCLESDRHLVLGGAVTRAAEAVDS